jgi:tetratricopeptide (TPR) repeat protein
MASSQATAMPWLVDTTTVGRLGGGKSVSTTERARMHGVRIVAILGSLLCGAPPAFAGPANDCNQVRDLGRQLRGCTAYIGKGDGGPENLATAYLNRANVYAQRGKHALAIKDYVAAMALSPSNPLAPYNRGNLYFDMKRYELAVADYSRAIALDERFALAFLNRGLAHERLGDTGAAAKDYTQALAIDPTNKAAQDSLKRVNSH